VKGALAGCLGEGVGDVMGGIDRTIRDSGIPSLAMYRYDAVVSMYNTRRDV
jgi:hypothetical protein